MRYFAPLLLLSLVACAPRAVFSNEAGVVIRKTGSLGTDRIYALATDHCAQYGKVAKMTDRDYLANTLSFDCVAK